MKMNLYFVVEGKTEQKVYPQWLSHLVPGYKQVKRAHEVDEHNYYLFSAGGYPSILENIANAAEEINNSGKFSHLVVCLDADEVSVKERIVEVNEVFELGN
ncbi:MAG: hypothetical protein GY757_14095, partial [bacterium]|nr:hypothetical protein [bacterium]